jgi:hypothetical protein
LTIKVKHGNFYSENPRSENMDGKMKIWVMLFLHQNGVDVEVYQTQAEAYSGIAEIMRDCLKTSIELVEDQELIVELLENNKISAAMGLWQELTQDEELFEIRQKSLEVKL